jgi:beta-1,2-mannobiose phosphorylase / 1,2-beta-oligomannan phosphorylase
MTQNLVARFLKNPLIGLDDVKPSVEGFEVISVFNPGAFTFNGKIGLIVRVAERPIQRPGFLDSMSLSSTGEILIESFSTLTKGLQSGDSREFVLNGVNHLTTISHFRLAWSEDGENFIVENEPLLIGEGSYETLGIEDARVTEIDGTYYLTYTAVSRNGYGVGMRSTSDWKHFKHHGVVIPPFNKDAVLFPEKISGSYYMLHRPTGSGLGGPYIWVAKSPDLLHWGENKCVAQSRLGMWDSARVGAGAAPIKTARGWLVIYHGVEILTQYSHRYCLGAILLKIDDPSIVIARSEKPFMVPEASYEVEGFFGNVVFSNGHVVRGDEVLLYYGAADSYCCGARLSLSEILASLKEV